MGYVTCFELDVLKGEKNIEEILHELESNDFDFEGLYYAVDLHGQTLECVKWYDHEIDMKKLSLLYPGYVFVLNGEGEESRDIWVKYFKDGKMQASYAEIILEDYDETQLH